MLVLLFESLGLSNPMDPAQYTEAFEKASQDCVVDFVVRCSTGALRYVPDNVHDKVLEIFGTAAPDGFEKTARPLSIHDYRNLAQKCKYTYLGVMDFSGEAVHAEFIPSTIFTETACFALPSQDSTQIVTGYFRLAMSLQRKQPTLQEMKDRVEEFYRGGSQMQSLEQHVLQCFEGASQAFTRHLMAAVHSRREFQHWYASVLAERLTAIVFDDAAPIPEDVGKPTAASSDLREKAAMLQTEAFQVEVDGMSAWHAATEYGRVRRKTVPLAQQCLTSPALAGFEVAVHRGMLHLVLDYQEELLRWERRRSDTKQ